MLFHTPSLVTLHSALFPRFMPLAPHPVPRYNKRIGALAQLGERKVRNLEVRGSIPLCSTNDKK